MELKREAKIRITKSNGDPKIRKRLDWSERDSRKRRERIEERDDVLMAKCFSLDDDFVFMSFSKTV